MRKLLKKHAAKLGLPPGTLVPTSDAQAPHTRVSVVRYDQDNLSEEELPTDAGCPQIGTGPGVTWVRVSGLQQVDVLEGIGKCFDLHPLVLEDILNTGQRPKLEAYPEYLYVVARIVRWDEQAREFMTEQISVVLGRGHVLSFQESDADIFQPILARIRAGTGRIRGLGADYLAYAVLDLVVDGYFVALEGIGDEMDALEKQLAEAASPDVLRAIHRVKRELVVLRKVTWPLREAVVAMYRDETPLVTDTVRVYLRDVYDHTIHAIETAEALRDVAGGLLDLYASTVGNQMNSVMQVLTIIATIFIPLTFIVGLYGMNFENMPEYGWPWAYPTVLGLMVVIGLGMLWWFRRKGWF